MTETSVQSEIVETQVVETEVVKSKGIDLASMTSQEREILVRLTTLRGPKRSGALRRRAAMIAETKTFHRDLAKTLAEIVTFDGTITVKDLHDRQNQIRLLRKEAYAQHAAGLFTDVEISVKIWPIDYAMEAIHRIAIKNGVSEETVEEFNKERWDRWDVKDPAECRERIARKYNAARG